MLVEVSPSAASSCEAEFQETSFHETLFQDALSQEALFQEAEFQETLFQETLFQEAEFHDALSQEALFQDAFARAAPIHAVLSKVLEFTNASSARFGFGGAVTFAAASAVSSPTPLDAPTAGLIVRAVTISAPLTWSGVQSGWRARMSAAVPDTTGAANDVPESCM